MSLARSAERRESAEDTLDNDTTPLTQPVSDVVETSDADSDAESKSPLDYDMTY